MDPMLAGDRRTVYPSCGRRYGRFPVVTQPVQTHLQFLQSDPNVVVTDPKGVAVAWGMSPPTA
jgi:hypothetical protein